MRSTTIVTLLLFGALLVGCKTTPVNRDHIPMTELDPAKGETLVAPPGPGDVTRTFKADRKDVVKATWRAMDARIPADFAIDAPGILGIPQDVTNRVRSVTGKGFNNRPMKIEMRPEGDECIAIIRANAPMFDPAIAEIMLDKIDADLKTSRSVTTKNSP